MRYIIKYFKLISIYKIFNILVLIILLLKNNIKLFKTINCMLFECRLFKHDLLSDIFS